MVAVKIAIGSDKSGFYLKEFILARLSEKGIEITDLGTADVEQPHPFFEVASIVGQAVSNGEYERAILICGTGMGMSQVANKFRGVLAACCETTYSARMCRAINNSNILCMGGWVIGPELGLEMAEVFLSTEHTQGSEEWRQAFLKNAYQQVVEIDRTQTK